MTLRPIERDDIDFLHRVMNDPRVWRPAVDIDPMNYEQGSEFFETVISDSDGVHCLACDGEEPLDVVSLTGSQYGPDETVRSRDAELAYWFAPEHHGDGFGSDAAARMVQYAFEDRNLWRVSSRAGSFNDASIGLLESLGFELGKTFLLATLRGHATRWLKSSSPFAHSQRVRSLMDSLGFEHEGSRRQAAWFRGEYHDMRLYGLLREEW